MYVKINSFIPNAEVKVVESNCVKDVYGIGINKTTYVSASADGLCLLQDSWAILALLSHRQELARYIFTISLTGSSLSPQGLNQVGENSIVATFYPHSGLQGTQDWVNISLADREDAWMSKDSQALENKAINSIIIPGTHDTGTYGISEYSEISSDMSEELKFWLRLDPFKQEHLKNWSITQNLNITEQLETGIRYFDLRLCKTGTGILSTCHIMVGDTIKNILDGITLFLAAPNHAKEIVILDFNHLLDISDNDVDQLADMLKVFDNKIASPLEFTPNSLLSTFWEHKKQVIVFIDSNYASSRYPDFFWAESLISSPWPNKQNLKDMEQSIQQALNNRDKQKLFVLQTQETPSTDTIIDSFNKLSGHPDTLLKMTGLYKRDLSEWLLRAENQQLLRQKGNVVIEDFSNGLELVEMGRVSNQN